MPKNRYTGDPLDQTWQDIKERPFKGRGETVDATDKEDSGKMRSEGVESALKRLSQDKKFDDIDSWIDTMRNWKFEWRQELAGDESLPLLVRTCLLSSIMQDMSEYNARPDMDLWAEYITDLSVPLMKLHGDGIIQKRHYLGDPALHERYKEFITEALPERAPDPLNQPVES